MCCLNSHFFQEQQQQNHFFCIKSFFFFPLLTLKFCPLEYFLICQLWALFYGVQCSHGLQREFSDNQRGYQDFGISVLWLFLYTKTDSLLKRKKKGRQRTVVVRPCPNTCVWLFLHFLGMTETDISKEQRKSRDGLCLKAR